MKAAAFFFSLIFVTICISLGINCLHAQSAQASSQLKGFAPAADAPSILAATVQIYLFPAEAASANGEMIVERGLGSLVQTGGETLIVTHDHRDGIEETGKVQFLDAGGALLVEGSGDEFRGMIHYQDGGTLLLRNTDHYWFHTGEAHAVRQMLGHGDLSQFVGSFEGYGY
jgi:hypothetical protein